MTIAPYYIQYIITLSYAIRSCNNNNLVSHIPIYRVPYPIYSYIPYPCISCPVIPYIPVVLKLWPACSMQHNKNEYFIKIYYFIYSAMLRICIHYLGVALTVAPCCECSPITYNIVDTVWSIYSDVIIQ